MNSIAANDNQDNNFMALPTALASLSQWVVWRAEPREDGKKPAKVPYSPTTRKPASVTDPTTWGTFDQALATRQRYKVDGIGFVFTESAPFVGIDLDNCRNPETGALDPWAEEIVQQLDSYTEVSPSGTGLHIIVRGQLPRGTSGLRTGQLELYSNARFFAMTGDRLAGFPADPQDRQPELDQLLRDYFPASQEPEPSSSQEESSQGGAEEGKEEGKEEDTAQAVQETPSGLLPADQTLLDRMFQAANGEKAAALWSSDWEALGYSSRSEADQALVNILAFYTQDPAQIDRLFRLSGLYRDKWDKPTYRDRTIANALRITEQATNPRPPKPETPQQPTTRRVSLATLGQSARNPTRPPLQYLPLLGQPGVFILGFSHLIAAFPKTGKTTLLLENFAQWARAGYTILYITEEPQLLWEERYLTTPSLQDALIQNQVNVIFGLGLPVSEIRGEIQTGTEQLVIIDTLKLLGIEDENNSAQINKTVTPFITLCRSQNKTPIFVHHTTKREGDYGKGVAGGYMFVGIVDIFMEVYRQGPNPNTRIIKGIGRYQGSFEFRYEKQDDALIPLGTPESYALDSVKGRLKKTLTKAWQTTKALRDALDSPDPSPDEVLKALVEMANAGDIDRDPPLSDGSQQGKTYRWRLRAKSRVIPWDVISIEPTLDEQILDALDNAASPLSAPAIARLINKSDKRVRTRLETLTETGQVERISETTREFLYRTPFTRRNAA